ncbi:unnamed protein product [Knipowitschia caucasica]|uniref:B-block binding subunit of TFIIIC domain-containing protein n=1 Tax=Knipowitschia caucasica TaxID=637954 RepID=A0AAV2LI09_KNICA
MDALSALLDEVALEGLDGITLPSLWLRLESRRPKFPQKIDHYTKGFLWRALVHNPEICFYEQPQERQDVEVYDRFQSVDPDTGIEHFGPSFDNRKDVYPASFITDHPDGIQGSCGFFWQRRDVGKQIHSASNTPLLTLEQAWERFGRRLVLVASQKARFRVLIGTQSDPDLKLSDESYCLLERVGRSRWNGELQRDLSNSSFNIEPRKIFYLRKALVQHNLVTVQSHVCRLDSGTQQYSCLLLLRRFHSTRRSKYDMMMERVSNILEASPGQHCTQMALREHLHLNEGPFQRIFKYMRSAKLVELFTMPLEELDPESGPCVTKRGTKVQVSCIKLLKPYSRKKIPDDKEEEEEEGADLTPEGRILERDLLSQAYSMVVSSGTSGLTCVAMGVQMHVGKLERRMLCRQLEREGVVKGFMEDVGRQRTTKFLSHKCVEVNDSLQQFVKEHERNQLLCSSDSPMAPSTKTLSNIDMCRKSALWNTQQNLPAQKRTCKAKKGSKKSIAMQKGPAESTTAEKGDLPLPLPPPSPSPPEAAADTGHLNIVTDVQPPVPEPNSQRHKTCRLLRRKNLIVEAIQDLKIFDGLYPFQKIITAEEKNLGFSTKCCRKTVLRLVQALAREGLIKLYTTTVIQDGVTKKVDLYAHPSIQPSDEIVQRTIDQVRFKMSGCHSNVRPPEDGKCGEPSKGPEGAASTPLKDSKSHKKKPGPKHTAEKFNPTTVRGLSRTFGYQPKMHRMRVVHNFLWYLIYGHPLRHNPETQTFEKSVLAPPSTAAQEEGAQKKSQGVGKGPKGDEKEHKAAGEEPPRAEEPQGTEEPEQSRSTTERMLLSEDEEGTPPADFKVYSEEEPWKKYVPPVKLHKDYSSGWVMLGDLILCLPLSIYIQVIQVNYKVEGLEEYLNDPEKQHYLVRCLPARMKRQLLYKRRYIFSFHDNLKKLAYMGLIQFGPLEKFRDKDQTFIYLKRHATIVDTTSAEPHYWLVTENPERPFDRRSYTFNTSDDMENFWFDLMCVCLNTPLGVIRSKKGGDETEPSFVRDPSVFVGLSYLIKGSLEVVDDGVIPGDGKGAGGLCSEFFAHLKRNWLWTNHLLVDKQRRTGLEADDTKVRLNSLCRSSLQLVLQAERTALPSYLTSKKMLVEVQVVEEPSSRNKQVVGGKQKKRKRVKKEVVKPPRKKKERAKRSVAHDARDHEALKQMTRQRVYWSLQEDSLMMLCAAATHLLNTRLKRPFVPYCVVRDVLHSEFDKSRDKTSVAVGRRTRHILKNPQTLLNYRICLAEVGQDKSLLKLLEENLPKNPDNPAACAEAFSEYVRLLRQKFSSTEDPRDLQIPDSKEQLFAWFKISAIEGVGRLSDTDTLNCTEDIHAIVLHNLIQSTLAMTNSQMKSSRSFQTFHVYSCYSQELLCQVFVQCRKRGLVNRRRINCGIGPKKNRALPILPMSYQLSLSYYRCFSWRFPQVLCTDSFRFVRDLLSLPRGDHHPVTYFHQETENRAPDGELLERKPSIEDQSGTSEAEGILSEPDVSDMMHFSLELPGGACAAALSLLSLGLLSVHLSIPKQMVVVDSTLVDSDTVKSTLEDEEEEDDEAEETKKSEVKVQKASHTKYLMMKGYCAPGIVKLRNLNTNDNIVVESCVIKVQLRERPAHALFSMDSEPALDLSVCGPSLLPSGLSLCLPTPPVSLEECLSRLQEQGYSAEDLQACTVLWHALERAGERGLSLGEFPQRLEELKLARPPRTRTLHQYTQDLQQQGEVVLVGAQGARWVLRRHAQPWLITLHTAQWTKAMVEENSLSTRKYLPPNTRKRRRGAQEESSTKRMALDTCEQREGNAADDTSHEAMGNMGVEDRSLQAEEKQRPTSPQPVSSDHKGAEEGAARAEEDRGVPHEEEQRQKTDSPIACPGESVSFVVRPWRMVDGKLNRVVCKGMLEALLHHIMSVPGTTEEKLLQHYRAVLQPLVTLELLQALIELGCVTRKTVARRAKASLFSDSSPSALSSTPSPLGMCVYYEPTVSCVLRLSQVLPHERHWNSGVP